MIAMELIGWMALGFFITYLLLELGTRIVAARISNRLFLMR
jgi:hypothetical protein